MARMSIVRLASLVPPPAPVFGSVFTAGAFPDGTFGFVGATPPPGARVGVIVPVATGVAAPGGVGTTVVVTAASWSTISLVVVSPAAIVTLSAVS
jgi:hypothetical protein